MSLWNIEKRTTILESQVHLRYIINFNKELGILSDILCSLFKKLKVFLPLERKNSSILFANNTKFSF